MSMYFEDSDLESEYELLGDEDLGLDSELEEEQPYEPEDFAAMGIDPEKPTKARPGSEAKVLMLSARYAAGLPLWNCEDCYEHGPRESELRGGTPQRRT
jgi:hypothetical protein